MTPPAQRPARFLRDREGRGDSGRGHRRSRQHGVRPEHPAGHARRSIGYAPIEPDGSVRVKVPANVALALSVLDANGRRIVGASPELAASRAGPRADLQRLPRTDEQSLARPQHGVQRRVCRCDEHGRAFPNTVGTFSPDAGETMAETRTRVSCQTDCAALEPSVDVRLYGRVDRPCRRDAERADLVSLYGPDDDGAGRRQLHRPLGRRACRIVINYETHIHPLWNAPRTLSIRMTT